MLCLLFAIGWLSAPAQGQPDAERARIDYLIESVAGLHAATFVRNGGEYDAQQAADHLRLKLRNAGNRVRTAEEFIACCATGSSMTGEKYRVRFADGRTVDMAEFLRAKLAAYAASGRPSG
jgi:hypothetical protein